MCLSLLLVGDAFRKFYRMRGSHNKHVTFLYRLLFFWWISKFRAIKHISSRTHIVWYFTSLRKVMGQSMAMVSSVLWVSTISLWTGSMLSQYSGFSYICLISGNFDYSKGKTDIFVVWFYDELKGKLNWDGTSNYYLSRLLN